MPSQHPWPIKTNLSEHGTNATNQCYGLNYVPPKFVCWIPNNVCANVWSWRLTKNFRFRWGYKGGDITVGLVSSVRGYILALAICKPAWGLLAELNHVSTLISDFQNHEKIKLLSRKPSNLWYFVMAAQANGQQYKCIGLKVDTIFFLFIVLVHNAVLAHSKCLINPRWVNVTVDGGNRLQRPPTFLTLRLSEPCLNPRRSE